jgi:hypothetical protein
MFIAHALLGLTFFGVLAFCSPHKKLKGSPGSSVGFSACGS